MKLLEVQKYIKNMKKIVKIWYGRVVASWGSFYDCLA